MDKLRVREVILVEGKYDKIALEAVVDGLIFPVDGFAIFKDKARKELLRRLAAERGVVILTDPDGGGVVIRSHLKGILPPERVKEAFIPDVPGKERRKRAPGKAGTLGVEGMKPQALREALLRAGVGARPARLHQGRTLHPGSDRHAGREVPPPGPAKGAGPARQPVDQRPAGGAERHHHPGGGGGIDFPLRCGGRGTIIELS